MTVSELIALLQEFPPDVEVVRDDFSMGADRVALSEALVEENIAVWPTPFGDKWREKVVTIK